MRKILILGDDDSIVFQGVIPDGGGGGFKQVNVHQMIRNVLVFAKQASQGGRKLGIDDEPHCSRGDQHRMVSFSSGIFQACGDVIGFQIGVIFQNLLSGDPGGQQIQHILDPDAQAPNTGPASALFRVEGDSPVHGPHVVHRVPTVKWILATKPRPPKALAFIFQSSDTRSSDLARTIQCVDAPPTMTRVVQNLLLSLMIALGFFGAPGAAAGILAAQSKAPATRDFRPAKVWVVFGEQYDPDLALYYLRARFYSPQAGRFWTMDSWEGENGNPITLNKYAYGNDNPVLYTDPSGHFGIGGSLGAMSIAMNISGLQIDAGLAALDGVRNVFGTTPYLEKLFAAKETYDNVALASGIAGGVAALYNLTRWVIRKGPDFGRSIGNIIRRIKGPLSGSGPVPGVLEVSLFRKSTKAFRNYKPSHGQIEFIYDPDSARFLVGQPSAQSLPPLSSPHEYLSSLIDGKKSRVVGGFFKRGSNGDILTNEMSGHFHQNWTPEIREEFRELLEMMTGQKVNHHAGM